MEDVNSDKMIDSQFTVTDATEPSVKDAIVFHDFTLTSTSTINVMRIWCMVIRCRRAVLGEGS